MIAGAPAHEASRPGTGRIRVLYLIDSLGRGGAEHLLAAYLRHLPSLGIEPVVAALQQRDGNPTAADIESRGVPVLDLGIARLRQRGAYRSVADAVDRSDPDVVHTQLEFANLLGAAAAARRGIPVVSTLHTLEEPPLWSRAGLRMQLMAWSLRRHADLVVAVSEHARRHHLRHLRLPPTLVRTIHNGIEVDEFASDAADGAAARTGLGLPAGAAVIVTVAVLRPPKGIDRMLRALPDVLAHYPDARYLVVGDGEARADLEAEAARWGVADRVTFAGSRADVPDMLAAADLFVLPSLTEALPTVIAEAMASGLPVVATDVGGTAEMVGEATGIVVPPDDVPALSSAVLAVLGDRESAAALGEAGRNVARERFDLRRQAGRLTAEYRRLIGAHRP